jgi:hypothetical protein
MHNRDITTVQQFCERNPAFTEGAVRWHIFNAENNGLEAAGAIVRIGRRVYLDAEKFINTLIGDQEGEKV